MRSQSHDTGVRGVEGEGEVYLQLVLYGPLLLWPYDPFHLVHPPPFVLASFGPNFIHPTIVKMFKSTVPLGSRMMANLARPSRVMVRK